MRVSDCARLCSQGAMSNVFNMKGRDVNGEHARIIVIQFQFYSNLANYWLCARVSDNLCAAVQMQIHKISLMLQMRRAAMQHGRG
jgi:hypothetical protein